MFALIVELSQSSKGLIPLMGVVFLIALTAIVERLYFYARVLASGERLEHDLERLKYRNRDDLQAVAAHYDGTIQGALVRAALAFEGEDAESMERQLDEAIMWQQPKLDRNLWLIDTSVTLGPLLGLLGTIIGMIESFNVLNTAGTGNPGAVTGGIAHALIATAAGLCIAIVSVVFLNYFNKRMRLALHQMDLICVMLVNRFHGGGSQAHGREEA